MNTSGVDIKKMLSVPSQADVEWMLANMPTPADVQKRSPREDYR